MVRGGGRAAYFVGVYLAGTAALWNHIFGVSTTPQPHDLVHPKVVGLVSVLKHEGALGVGVVACEGRCPTDHVQRDTGPQQRRRGLRHGARQRGHRGDGRREIIWVELIVIWRRGFRRHRAQIDTYESYKKGVCVTVPHALDVENQGFGDF